jgi:hypothetical protein
MSTPEVHGYAIRRGELYMCFDRHGDGEPWWGPWQDPFMCEFETVEKARRWAQPGDNIEVTRCGPRPESKRRGMESRPTGGMPNRYERALVAAYLRHELAAGLRALERAVDGVPTSTALDAREEFAHMQELWEDIARDLEVEDDSEAVGNLSKAVDEVAHLGLAHGPVEDP